MKLKNDIYAELNTDSKAKDESQTKMYTISMETGNILNFKYLNEDKIEDEQNNEQKNNFKTENLEKPSTRLLSITKSINNSCGFNLTRTKWDPYPWVSFVDVNTPAEMSGLKVGDCVLEVNGKDVLGLRIADIAKLVKAKSENVTLLLWSAGCDAKLEPETLCDAPMPHTLQRLSIIVQSILSIIECPVCLDTISPPAMQCQNGHLLCVNCRISTDKCPVCRDRYTPRQALIAEQIYAAITNAFNLCRSEDKLRQKLFGTNVKHPQQEQKTQQQHQQEIMSNNMVEMSQDKEIKLNATKSKAKSNGVSLPTTANKFLTKLLHSKACSMDNLSNGTTTQTQMVTTASTPTTATSTTTTLTSNTVRNLATSSSICSLSNCNPTLNVMSCATNSNDPARQSATNQLNNEKQQHQIQTK